MNRQSCQKCIFSKSIHRQTNECKNTQESDIFYRVQKDKKVEILLSPTLPLPYFLLPFFKTFVTHPPKINELKLLSSLPLSSDPDTPPKFGTCTNLGYGTPQSNTKRQNLLECVLTGNSKLYLGKIYTEEKIKELNEEEVEKLFNNYEAKLSGQMIKSLGHSIINMYSMGACSALGITNQDALSEDLENDPFLNSALQRFTCELYYRFGSFLAPLSVGIITSRHYLLSERNKNGNGEQERTSGTGDNKNGGDEKTTE